MVDLGGGAVSYVPLYRPKRYTPRQADKLEVKCSIKETSGCTEKEVRFFFFFVTLGLELSDTTVYEP